MHPRSVSRRTIPLLVGGAAAAALAFTGSIVPGAQGAPASLVAETESYVVPVPENSDGWTTQATECHTDATLTPQQRAMQGPGRVPFGFGSHRFQINEYTSQTEVYRTAWFDTVYLDELDRMEYSTYAIPKSEDGPLRQPTYLRLSVDLGQLGRGARAVEPTYVYFVPKNNTDQQPVLNGVWQSWDVFGGNLSVGGDTGLEDTVTWDELLVDYPDAQLVNDREEQDAAGGSVSFVTGCGLAGDVDSQRNGYYNVDRLILGFNDVGEGGAESVLFDLEDEEFEETEGEITPVHIGPDSDGPWHSYAYDWDTGRNLHTTQEFVGDAGYAPAGLGSLRTELSDDQNPQRIEQYYTSAYDGTPLRDLRRLVYWTNEVPNEPYWDGPQQPHYMYLRVDNDDDGWVDDILVYYPQNNGEVLNNEWQKWGALNGQWNLNGDSDEDDTFPMVNYIVEHPDAVISHGYLDRHARTMHNRPVYGFGGVGFQAGGGGDEQLNGDYYLDEIEISRVTDEDPSVVVGREFDLEPAVPVPSIDIDNDVVYEHNPGTVPPRCLVAGPGSDRKSVCENLAFFRVELSERTLVPVEVDYHTEDGPAVAGDDYVDTSGTLSFNPGDWVRYVEVPIVADKTFESSETFDVVLTDPENATLGEDLAFGRIRNDDTEVRLSSANVGDRQVEVAVATRWEASDCPVSIYRIVDGPNAPKLVATLNEHGELAPTRLDQTFRHGKHVRLYAVVTTDNGDYRSPVADLVVP